MSVYFRIYVITLIAVDFFRKQESLCTGFGLSAKRFDAVSPELSCTTSWTDPAVIRKRVYLR